MLAALLEKPVLIFKLTRSDKDWVVQSQNVAGCLKIPILK